MGMLNVGFAEIELRPIAAFPGQEVYILAKTCEWEENGMVAMFRYLQDVLDAPQTSDGFIVTYNFQDVLRPQVDVLSDTLSWAMDPCRQERWQHQCISWTLVVPPGAYYPFKVLLAGVFYIYPPTCTIYMVTDAKRPLDDDAVCFQPEESVLAAPILCSPGKAPPAALGGGAAGAVLAGAAPEAAASVGAGAGAGACPWGEVGAPLPSSFDVGFADLRQGVDVASGLGYFNILGQDEDITEESIGVMLDFMDAFTRSPNAAGGFSIMYDLRHLRNPSMGMVMRVAEWGADPSRKELWESLNRACKIVISSGLRFTLCKGALSTFFMVCPPIVRTYLLTDPDQSEEDACIFEPSPSAPAAAVSNSAGDGS